MPIFDYSNDKLFGIKIDKKLPSYNFRLFDFNGNIFADVTIKSNKRGLKNVYSISSSVGVNGYGAYLYKFILSYMYPKYVCPDYTVSDEASSVWENFRHYKKNIDMIYLDDYHSEDDYHLNFAYRITKPLPHKDILISNGKHILKKIGSLSTEIIDNL